FSPDVAAGPHLLRHLGGGAHAQWRCVSPQRVSHLRVIHNGQARPPTQRIVHQLLLVHGDTLVLKREDRVASGIGGHGRTEPERRVVALERPPPNQNHANRRGHATQQFAYDASFVGLDARPEIRRRGGGAVEYVG